MKIETVTFDFQGITPLFLLKDGQRLGVECKRAAASRLTPSMRTALDDLQLDRLFVFYPGDRPYSLAEKVEVLPLESLTGQNPPPASP